MAATVLIAEHLFPITEGHIQKSQLDSLLEQVDQVLASCEQSTNIARKCRVTLKRLNDKVKLSLYMSAARPESDQPQDSRVDQPTGDVPFEHLSLQFGSEGLGIDALDVYPFSSNDWPVSFGDVVDDNTGNTFWALY